MKRLTNCEITELILSTCVGCCTSSCQLNCIWPILRKETSLSTEEKEKLHKQIMQRLNLKVGKQNIVRELSKCADVNPYDNDVTIGSYTLPTP